MRNQQRPTAGSAAIHGMMACFAVALFVAACDSGGDNEPTTSLAGTVLDNVTREPVEAALVRWQGGSAATDSAGRYSFAGLRAGVDSLIVTATGFQRFAAEQIVASGENRVDVELEPLPVDRPEIRIWGTVVDAMGNVIAQGRVQIGSQIVTTGADGTFSVVVPRDGTYAVFASATHYAESRQWLPVGPEGLRVDINLGHRIIDCASVPVAETEWSGIPGQHDTIHVRWEASGNGDPFIGYRLDRIPYMSYVGTPVAHWDVDFETTTLVDTAVPGGTYTYRLTVVNADGNVGEPCTSGRAYSIRMDFADIEPGTFAMGTETGKEDERPVHEVTLTRPFWISRYELRNSEWEAVTGIVPFRNPNPDAYRGANDARIVIRPDEPQYVTHYVSEAVLFLNELSRREGLAPCYADSGAVIGGSVYDCEGYRLPTEAEWEYAARAGTTGDYFWEGGTARIHEYARTNGLGSTEPISGRDGPDVVGRYLPNAWGLYDVVGNMAELVQDRYDATWFTSSPSVDPEGPESGEWSVARGGDWITYGVELRRARVSLRVGPTGGTNRYSTIRVARTRH